MTRTRTLGKTFKLSVQTPESIRLVTVDTPEDRLGLSMSGNTPYTEFTVNLYHDEYNSDTVQFLNPQHDTRINSPSLDTRREAQWLSERLQTLAEMDMIHSVSPRFEFFCEEGSALSRHKVRVYAPVDKSDQWIRNTILKIVEVTDGTLSPASGL